MSSGCCCLGEDSSAFGAVFSACVEVHLPSWLKFDWEVRFLSSEERDGDASDVQVRDLSGDLRVSDVSSFGEKPEEGGQGEPCQRSDGYRSLIDKFSKSK
jgi:hypothetical protein